LDQEEILKTLGRQIRSVRQKSGLSQEQLALKAGIDRSYYGGIERGERNASFLTLAKIASCLKCDVASFAQNIPAE